MSAMLTKTARRAVNSQIRALQRERRDWLAGRGMPWGTPWCHGPGHLGHQEPLCEGCGTVAWCRDRADEVSEQIRQLEAAVVPALQGVLW
jgi:hypothetical protein